MERTPALISIIIPLFNRQELIKETLDAVLQQTYTNWECIIVDDHSTDKSLLVVKEYAAKDPRIQVFRRPDPLKKGANSCRNYGFLQSKGNYIQWFDSDDIMHEKMLEKKQDKIVQHDFDFVACKFYTFQKDINSYESPDFTIQKSLIADYLCGGLPVNTPMVLWKRKLIESRRFNEYLSRAQELDFISNIFIEKKPKGILLDEYLIKVREHENSITGKFNKGGKKEMKDEVRVRFTIHANYSDHKEATLYMYYKSIKNTLQNKQYVFSISHLLKTLFKIKRRFTGTQIKLLFLAITLGIFGRGLEKYKITLERYA